VTRAALFTKHQKLAEHMAADWHIAGGDRDDVVQELRIALWEAAGAWDANKGAPFPQFAREVMRRRMADVLTKANRLKHQTLTHAKRTMRGEDETVDVLDYIASRDLQPDDLIVQLDELRGLIGAILGLTDNQRRAIVRVINGLGCNEKVDDNALQMARRKLKRIRDEGGMTCRR
jgi:RNA polymerase sigma factor (sigma-70 family)